MTSNGLADIPSSSSSVIVTNPRISEVVYCSAVNLTLMANSIQ